MPEVDIIGCGPGNPDLMTRGALKAVQDADLLVGAKRLLDMFDIREKEKKYIDRNISGIPDFIAGIFREKRVAVLVTGDPGIHSFSALVLKRLGHENCRIFPGISSFVYAFNRLGIPWHDARVLSAHHDIPPELVTVIPEHAKICILLSPRNNAAKIVSLFDEKQLESKTIYVCEKLSCQDERIRKMTCRRIQTETFDSPALMIILENDAGTVE